MSLSALNYAPDFKLDLGEETVPGTLRNAITGLQYISGLDAADRVELSIHDPDLRWIEHPLLKLGNRLALALGYAPDGLDQVFVGELVSLSPSFPSSGAITINLAAQDARFKLQQSKKSRWFALGGVGGAIASMPDVVVSSLLTAGNGLFPIVEPVAAGMATLLGVVDMAASSKDRVAAQKKIRLQNSQNDFTLLQQIAKQNGWEILVEHNEPLGGKKLRFMAPIAHLEPVAIYEYGRSLIDFSPRLSQVGQVVKVVSRFWVPEIKTQFQVALGYDWDKGELELELRPSLPSEAAGLDDQKPYLELAGKQVNQFNAARLLVSELLPRLNSRLTASATVIGSSQLRAGEVVEIQKVGPFSGRYRIVEASHSVDSAGYMTTLSLRKEIWFESPAIAAPGASFSL
jgi:phage protein D